MLFGHFIFLEAPVFDRWILHGKPLKNENSNDTHVKCTPVFNTHTRVRVT